VKELEKLRYIDGKSDWIDLRVAEEVKMKAGEFRLISMGISVELPKGYEMWILPRSSAFKNFGVIQTNAMGVVDESFCGDNDIIHMPILAMRDTEMHINDRIGQFRIAKHQAEIHFVEVEHLNHADRGGFGTTGKS
jgi:possible dUTP diphosphatase